MPVTQVDSPATLRDCCLVTTHSKIWIRIEYRAPARSPRLKGPNSPLTIILPIINIIKSSSMYTCRYNIICTVTLTIDLHDHV